MTISYATDFGQKFQARILAVALLSPTFVMRYRSALSHEFFESDAHRVIAKCLLALVDKYCTVPSKDTLWVDVCAIAPKDDLDTLEAVVDNLYGYDISDEAAVIDKAVAFGKHQALINAVIASGDDIVAKKTDKIEDRIRGAFAVGEDLLNIGIDFLAYDRSAHYLNRGEDNTQRIPTGVVHVDAAMGGGPKRGTLNVVLAPPKKGKTTTLINFAYGAAHAGYRVVYYSLEMDKMDVTERFDDRLMGPKVSLKATDPDQYVAELKEEVLREVPGNIFVQQYFTRKASVATLRAHLSLLKARGYIPDCIAEGSMVLTDHGMVPIEKVTCNHRLWDGNEWVSHGGPILKGIRNVITYAGLTATPDHQVWTEHGWRSLIACKRLGLRIAQTGIGGTPVRIGKNYVGDCAGSGGQVPQARVCSNSVCAVPKGKVDPAGQPTSRSCERLPDLLVRSAPPKATETIPSLANHASSRPAAALSESEVLRMGALRCSGDPISVPERSGCLPLDSRKSWPSSRETTGSDRQRRELCSGEPALVNQTTKHEPHAEKPCNIEGTQISGGASRGDLFRPDALHNVEQTEINGGPGFTQVENDEERTERVWDILDAGPLHRFTVQGLLAHNCIFVDYADILKANTRLGEMRHEQAGIYEELRTLAGEFDVVLWTASQTNKAGLDKEVVTIADFAESFEKAAIADAVWAFCQSQSEQIQRKFRLFAAAMRKCEDSVTVECDIRRDQCLIRSTGLFDAGYNQIHTKADGEASPAKVDKVSKEEETPHVTRVEAIKASVGMGAKKPDVRRRIGAPASAKPPTVQVGVRPGSQPAPRRRTERPTTTVAPKP